MNRNEMELFEDLDPPAGGKERFRRLLESGDAPVRARAGRGSKPRLAASLAAASAAAGVAAVSVVATIAVVAVLRFGNDTGGSLATDAATRVNENADEGMERSVSVYEWPDFDRLLGRPMQRLETSVVIDGERVAVAEVPSGASKIRIYQVQNN